MIPMLRESLSGGIIVWRQIDNSFKPNTSARPTNERAAGRGLAQPRAAQRAGALAFPCGSGQAGALHGRAGRAARGSQAQSPRSSRSGRGPHDSTRPATRLTLQKPPLHQLFQKPGDFRRSRRGGGLTQEGSINWGIQLLRYFSPFSSCPAGCAGGGRCGGRTDRAATTASMAAEGCGGVGGGGAGSGALQLLLRKA